MTHRNFSSARLITYSLITLVFFSSCRKEELDIQSPNNRRCSTYLEQFEAIWEGLDQWKNIFGNRSIYVCCFFVLDESGFTNIVTEKNLDKENNINK